MMWLFLAGAIAIEVFSTLVLRVSSVSGRRLLLIPAISGYVVSFGLLSVTLSLGMPVGMAYGVWTASGVALVSILARIIFRDPLTWVMGLGIGFIVAGILAIEFPGSAS
jgi:small multidrug resistance pump